MTAIRPKLLERLIGKKLYAQLDQFLALAEQGFDVAVQLPSQDIHEVFLGMCERELRARQLPYSVASTWEAAAKEKQRQDAELEHTPLLYVSLELPPPGSGFIAFNLTSVESLLPSISATVSRILEHAGLAMYLDVFDARKMSRIKSISSAHGLGALIDVVVQTAYLGGFSANEQAVEQYLDSYSGKHDKGPQTGGRMSFTALINDLLKSTQSPHCYLKAALSYYVVRSQGNSMTRASRILNISRTTLQQHLLLAEKFRVYELFENTTH